MSPPPTVTGCPRPPRTLFLFPSDLLLARLPTADPAREGAQAAGGRERRGGGASGRSTQEGPEGSGGAAGAPGGTAGQSHSPGIGIEVNTIRYLFFFF